MPKTKLIISIAALLFLGCMDSTSPTKDNEAINNSDPSKPSYLSTSPEDSGRRQEAVEKKRKGSQLAFQSLDPSEKPLQKTNSGRRIAYLRNWATPYSQVCNDPLDIFMDDENTDNNSQMIPIGNVWFTSTSSETHAFYVTYGAFQGITQPDYGTNTKFSFCSKTVTNLPPAQFDYAVLLLDYQCPSGSYPFYRGFDNDDDDNSNYYNGDLGPIMSQDEDMTHLAFCFVPKATTGTTLLDWDFGVFGNIHTSPGGAPHWTCASGLVITDDEDYDNSNYMTTSSSGAPYLSRMKDIINDAPNSHMIVSWCAPITLGL